MQNGLKNSLKSSKGFTLIELLIVIVIIGILAGVLVAVIDPATQQNRARDANVEATLNKVALAVGGYRSAYGDPPDALQLRGSIEGDVDGSTACVAGGWSCLWDMTNSPLPGQAAGYNCSTINNCCNATNPWVGSGAATDATPCEYRYEWNDADNGNGASAATVAPSQFKIWAKSYGVNNGVFVYSSENGGQIDLCDNTDWATCN